MSNRSLAAAPRSAKERPLVTPRQAAWCFAPLILAFVVQDRFTLAVLALAGVQAFFVASWDLLGGVSGQVSLGHALPFGTGAYAAMLLSGWSRWPPAAAVAGGALAGAAAAALQGRLGAHLSRLSLALLTLATAEAARELSGMLELTSQEGTLVGGEGGVPGVLFPWNEATAARIIAAALAVGLIALLRVARSNLGLAMRTVREDDRGAAASGINVVRVRVAAFALAGGVAGLAGGFAAGLVGRATPSMLSLEASLFVLAAAGVGGLGTVIGPATAGYALTAVLQWLDLSGPVRLTIYAVLVIAVGLVAPEGVISIRGLGRWDRWRIRRA